MHIHDLIGIGFGPSNIALAIALEEHGQRHGKVDACFIERQGGFAWHPDMLLDHAHMQISFLKDLVTPRNPSSRYSFLNYLHEKSRLQDFINLKTFFPSRHEFNDYLAWTASHFEHQCAFGESVFEVLPDMQGKDVSLLRVRSRDASGQVHERLTRSLVIGVGGAPNIPPSFAGLNDDARVFHSSRYLSELGRQRAPRRLAVIGAGQSAAEIFLDLAQRDGTEVDLITRCWAFKPSDDSPFVNEIFNPEYTDYVFNNATGQRAALLEEYMNTNYAAPDLELIQQIFEVFYRQKVTGSQRHRFRRRHEVEAVAADDAGVHLRVANLDTGDSDSTRYDGVVLATGYQRQVHRELLAPLQPWLGDCQVNRHYQVQAAEGFRPAVFLQGCCEPTHGLSDTLLSVMAVRTAEICQALQHALPRARSRAGVATQSEPVAAMAQG
ncbi:L-lysine 6-monooxygenase [Alcanivorax sp. S71-1-4]|uniref:lysine N(6)-hydroxylase/L-ornithine N(5)-oxygenase family protein n=1 Tax=Alcanivorax sp. S71-1-4 TaxID=1177159 RepID=UPI001357F21D|nr:lysine N(6)-hydroxylase/L-ornithine N(5)-oxygenase family protein [Alcanivorax sp. S71-1-4]KAF0809369.1 L-lysine 6-monooxygenase [Alcanivorax sp. S71-1-4]